MGFVSQRGRLSEQCGYAMATAMLCYGYATATTMLHYGYATATAMLLLWLRYGWSTATAMAMATIHYGYTMLWLCYGHGYVAAMLRLCYSYATTTLRLRWAACVDPSPAAPGESCNNMLSCCWSAERLGLAGSLLFTFCCASKLSKAIRRMNYTASTAIWCVCVCVCGGCECVYACACACACACVCLCVVRTHDGGPSVINAVETLMGWTLDPVDHPVSSTRVFSEIIIAADDDKQMVLFYLSYFPSLSRRSKCAKLGIGTMLFCFNYHFHLRLSCWLYITKRLLFFFIIL